MPSDTLEIEAESLEKAREAVKSRIPAGLSLLSEEIISDGSPKTATAAAATCEAAAEQARRLIPADAVVLSRRGVSVPQVSAITVEAFDESEALAVAQGAATRIGESVVVRGVSLLQPGAKGFLGVGKKRGEWAAELFHQAVCEISYQAKARVRFEIGQEPKTVPTLVRDFLVEHEDEMTLDLVDAIRNLVNSGASEQAVRLALQRGGRKGVLLREFLEQLLPVGIVARDFLNVHRAEILQLPGGPKAFTDEMTKIIKNGTSDQAVRLALQQGDRKGVLLREFLERLVHVGLHA